MNELLHIGFGAYITMCKVILITDMDAAKLKRELEKRGIDKASSKFWNAAGAKEISSVILCDDGMWVTSALGADTLYKRFKEIKGG